MDCCCYRDTNSRFTFSNKGRDSHPLGQSPKKPHLRAAAGGAEAACTALLRTTERGGAGWVLPRWDICKNKGPVKCRNILRNSMQKIYFSCGLTLTIEYPQILVLIKTLPLYCRQWLGNGIHPQTEEREEKKKHFEYSLLNNSPKPHLYINLSVFSQHDS